MVSFSCEACGNVLTKKKLDSHRSQCRGASFTCLDCMTHFRGGEYKSHTSCISEAQKYEGRFYKEKPPKRKSVTIADPTSTALVPRAAYVEDVPDDDVHSYAPPHAPSPPPAAPAAPAKPLNVFDFLVTDETPNASRISLGASTEQMSMVDHAPSVFETSRQLARITKEHDEESTYDLAFEENGFSYGAEPIRQQVFADTTNNHSQDFMTPGPKPKGEKDKPRSSGSLHVRNDSQNTTSSDKKRKRGGHVEDLNVSVANNARFEHEADTLMTDAPPSANATTGLTHSGLTGGLNRLMSKSEFPPSPDYSGGSDHHKDPASPLKRSRRDTHKPADDNGLGISIKGRAGRIMSTLGIAGGIAAATHTNGNTEKALVRTRRRSSSENDGSSQRQLVQQKRPRKHHKVHGRHTGTHSSQYVSSTQQPRHRSRRRSSNHEHHDSNSPDGRPARRLKAIEYKSHKANSTTPGSVSDSDAPAHTNGHRPQKSSGNPNQLVVYQSRSELFMSFVTKGPESERGCSINKVLKRYHRDLQLSGREDKAEEEKELWKGLRLRRNERGEVVVFCE